MKTAQDIIIAPVITEKSMSGIADKKYTFKVDKNANKIEIAQAVEDHSSHLKYEPRSIQGKIVADADRNNSMYLVFSRPIKYGLKHEKDNSREDHINRVYDFVQDKFGRNGYVKYWLDIPQTRKEQDQIWTLLDNEFACKSYIAGLLDEITKGKIR